MTHGCSAIKHKGDSVKANIMKRDILLGSLGAAPMTRGITELVNAGVNETHFYDSWQR